MAKMVSFMLHIILPQLIKNYIILTYFSVFIYIIYNHLILNVFINYIKTKTTVAYDSCITGYQ